MESSSDVHDYRVCSPTLQRVLDEVGTSLNDSSCKIAESIGPFSAQDVYIMQPSMFTSTSGGSQVIELAKRVVDTLCRAGQLTQFIRLQLASILFKKRLNHNLRKGIVATVNAPRL